MTRYAYTFIALYRGPYSQAATQVRLARDAFFHVGNDVRHHLHGEFAACMGLEHANLARVAQYMAFGVVGGFPYRAVGHPAGEKNYNQIGAFVLNRPIKTI